MSYEFKRLSDVEALPEVPEGATVLAEVNGAIKRIPGNGLGGAGIKTAIIKDSGYDNILAGIMSAAAVMPEYTYECINMTFDEAYATMASGEPLAVFGMLTSEGPVNVYGEVMFTGTAMGVPCIMIAFASVIVSADLYWTADGLSTEAPSSGK